MRCTVLPWLLAACGSDIALSPTTPPNTPPSDPATTTDPDTTPTDTTPTDTTPTSTTPVVPCAPDPVAIADCAAGGYAALVNGVGHETIRGAIAASTANDRIVVCPGVWTGDWTLNRRTLDAADPTPGATVFDGQGHHLLRMENTRLRGLTIRNGTASRWGGATIDAFYDTTIECMTAEDNEGVLGGVLYWETNPGLLFPDTLTIRDSTFSRNHAEYGGAVFALGGSMVIEDSRFTNNEAEGMGGAMFARNHIDNQIRRTSFEGNTATAVVLDGTGVIVITGVNRMGVGVEDVVFRANSGLEVGGLLIWAQNLDATVSGTTFDGNVGGGMWPQAQSGELYLDIAESSFTNQEGPALRLGSWFENDLVPEDVNVTIDLTSFEDNAATQGSAAIDTSADLFAGTVRIEATDTTFLRNDAPDGAVSLRASDLLDCTTCDFGAGADDNTPVDATKDGVQTDALAGDFRL